MTALPNTIDLGPLTLYDFAPASGTLCPDVVRGLAGAERVLPSKYFYDEEGARLFERITELEAYYPTRTEAGIFERHAGEMADRLGPGCRLVEFGSGSGLKTRILLEHLRAPAAYVPVDISRAQLVEFALSVAAEMPGLPVLPVCADYTAAFALPPAPRPERRTAAFFPGSTIGNFEPPQAEDFLRRVARLCGPGSAFLVGVDLRKDPAIIERAYNDPEGVTAAFNLNLLRRIDRECGADFDLGGFRHHALFDAAHGRVEMRLVCTRAQTVTIPAGGGETPLVVHFEEGDHITTEYSYKYHPEDFRALAARAGWNVARLWTDPREWFGEWLLTRD
ncbi:MAG TPA: L-histidine N(alpha)-methyltransferase [Longimicrobiaceae bacterium]|nr:L-histidine N(alpha)-methyltransferase [Longimicrobiaceae bacterium]